MNLKKNNCKNVFFSLSVIIIHINIPFCCNGSPFRDFYPLYIHIVVQSPVKRKIFKSFMRLIVFFFFSILAASRYITSWEFTSRIVSVFVRWHETAKTRTSRPSIMVSTVTLSGGGGQMGGGRGQVA